VGEGAPELDLTTEAVTEDTAAHYEKLGIAHGAEEVRDTVAEVAIKGTELETKFVDQKLQGSPDTFWGVQPTRSLPGALNDASPWHRIHNKRTK
jgi:hypothetical protein